MWQFFLFPFLWWSILCINLTGQGVLTLNIISGNVCKCVSGWDSHLIQWNQCTAHPSVGGHQAWAWRLIALWPSDWASLRHHWLTRFSGLVWPNYTTISQVSSMQTADGRPFQLVWSCEPIPHNKSIYHLSIYLSIYLLSISLYPA